MRTKFGGLNTVSGDLSLPENDSPSLMNIDFDISGSVRKRKGTLTIYEDLPTPNLVFVSRFVTIAGYEFIISKYNRTLRVLDFYNNRAEIIWERDDVFNTVEYLPYSVPLDDNINLLLCEKQAPVQVRFEEATSTATVDGSIEIEVGESWVNTYVDTVTYVNGVRVSASYSYLSGVITVTSASITIGDVVHVCTFSWQWWAESLVWFGDNFYQRVSRFGVSEEDKHVQIPNSIVTDEIPDSNNYGVYAFINDAFGNSYTYRSDNQPELSIEYSFSDGSNYTPSDEAYTSPSKFFITFGDISNLNERTFTDKEVVGNRITIIKHKLKDFDIVNFANNLGDLPANLIDTSTYYVKVIDEDTIELYSDVTLTTIVTIGARSSKTFTDLAVNYTDNFIGITAHGFTTGQPIRFTTTNTLPEGLSENTVYYAKSTTVNSFEVYFDKELRKKFIFVYRTEVFFDSTNTSGNIITIAQHNLFTGDAVRVRTANGTLPATLNATTVYYVNVLTADAIQLYYDSALTSVVPNYTGLTGNVFLYLDGGVHAVVADGLTTTIQRAVYDAVSFVRLRQLRFNNKKGVLNSNLDVYIGDSLATRSTSLSSVAAPSYYTHSTETLAPYTGTTVLQKFVSFTSSTPIGSKKDVLVRLVNTETKWCGTAALSTKYAFDNGSYVPAYGIGDYANYEEGIFPTFGALYQSRLCLGGVGAYILVSGVYDRLVREEPYRYFQVTDDLSNPLLDPFTVRVPFSQSDTVLAMKQWQQFLFVFTRTSTYKTTLDTNNQFSANVPTLTLSANVGCVGRDCVETTESTLFFLSENGVFNLNAVLQGEYRASEISLPVRNVVNKFTSDARVCYDSYNNKLYVYDERMMVYFTDNQVWSEYTAVLPWDVSSFVFWRNCVFLCCRLLCDFKIVKTEYDKYIDFSKEFTSGEVYIQTCAVRIPTYANVNIYDIPIPTSPVLSQQDLLVLSNGFRILFGDEWVKTSDGKIQIFNPVDGELLVFYKAPDTYNGTALYRDSVEVDLTGASLGLVNPTNVCTYSPYGGGNADGPIGTGVDNPDTGEKPQDLGMPLVYLPPVGVPPSRLYGFMSMTVNYTDTTTFSFSPNDYPSYASFLIDGILPIGLENIEFTDTFTTASLKDRSSVPFLQEGSVLASVELTKEIISLTSTLELWSETSDFTLSRQSLFFGENKNGLYANTSDPAFTFTLSGGNPSDRSVTGVLQPNGLYKATINFTSLNGATNFFLQSIYNPTFVESSSNIVYIGGVLQT